MAIQFSNLASTTLASGVSSSATSVSVTSASLFPSLGGSDYFYATLGDGAGSEIVKVTAISGTTFTVVRGQDGTSAISHSTGTHFALRVTAAALEDLRDSPNVESVSKSGDTMTGALLGTTASFSGSVTAASVVVSGNVDGRDVATDGTKLDGIEASATADQTNAEIRTAVEAASDSNVFTDADHTKLNAIEASATADQTGAQIKTAYEAETNAFTDAQFTKLSGIESSATADQSNAEIRALVESATDSNVFTDADHTKLNAVEASADVTDAINVESAGALMDSELTAIASVKALNQGVATTDSPTFSNLTLSGTASVKVPSGTTAQRDGTPANGMFRYNSTNEQFEGYQSSAWGAIGGGGGSNTFTTDTFTGNGTVTAYALSQVINSENNLMVFIGGVFQQQSAYSIATASGVTTLTFSEAPANTREIVIYSIASAVSGSNLNNDQFTANGSTTAFTLSIAPVHEANTMVFIDGVYQQKTDYAVSGTTLTFDAAPANSSVVEVSTFTQTDINVPVDNSVTTAILVDGSVTSAKIASDVALAGNPTAATQATGNTTTRLATTAFVQQEVTALVDSSPSTLDTLNELAAALGDDPNFATTTATSIGLKAPLASPTFTGTTTIPTADINGGTIDGTVIGGATPAAISGTTGTFSSTLGVTGIATFTTAIKGNRDISAFGANTGSSANRMAMSMEGAGVSRLICNGPDGSTNGTFEVFTAYSGGTGSVKLGIDAAGAATFASTVTSTGLTSSGGGSISGNLLVGASSASGKLTVGTFGDTARAAQFHGGSILVDGGAASEIIIGDGNVAYMSIQTTDDATAMKIRNFSGNADLVTIERASGNVGLGVTPEAWHSNAKALQVGDLGGLWIYDDNSNPEQLHLSENVYNNGEERYIQSDYASSHQQRSGVHTFKVAASGTADAVISWNSALTIDNSGNVLVGSSSTPGGSTDGAVIFASGTIASYVTSAPPAVFSRNASNGGDVVVIQQQGTTVGSIGTASGVTYFAGPNSSTGGFRIDSTGSNGVIVPTTTTGANRDAATDLGYSSGGTNIRFRDLYLSGGVYLGGTGAANKLTDYEEGTWTPTMYGATTAGSTSGGTFGGTYTKIGNMVTCTFSILDTTLASAVGHLQIGGFPFTAQAPNNREHFGVTRFYKFDFAAPSAGYFNPVGGLVDNATRMGFVQTQDNGTWSVVGVTNGANLYIEGTITYTT